VDRCGPVPAERTGRSEGGDAASPFDGPVEKGAGVVRVRRGTGQRGGESNRESAHVIEASVVNGGEFAALVSHVKANTVKRSYPVCAGAEPRTVEHMVIRAGLKVYRISHGEGNVSLGMVVSCD
jgi:hypothetical protein